MTINCVCPIVTPESLIRNKVVVNKHIKHMVNKHIKILFFKREDFSVEIN